MPSSSSGGSLVQSSQIVDGTIVNADINAAAAIDFSKIAGLIANPSAFLSIEFTAGTTHSLVTVANQRVLVIAMADITQAATDAYVTLTYNGVTKATQHIDTGGSGLFESCNVMYSEIPGAGTHDIVFSGGNGTLGNPTIAVIKLQVG